MILQTGQILLLFGNLAKMLLTKFTYTVDASFSGVKITLTRIDDSAVKVFYVASSNSVENMQSFMNSVTDQLAQDYFPKVKK